ncbi:MAG: hypothetical protein Q4B14_01695 [Clostridia bacterium]|nr:hypothetical protein [Clostridia bacterium]
MSLLSKAAYLKGLADGLKLDEDKKEQKVLLAVIDLFQEIAEKVDSLDEKAVAVEKELDMLDEAINDMGEFIYEQSEDMDFCSDDCDCDCDCCGDEACVICPTCGKCVELSEEQLKDGSLACPECGEELELEFD